MLEAYDGHRVIVEASNGKSFCGMVIDYCSPDENEIQQESIILRDEYSGMLIELYACDLVRIVRVNYKIKVKYLGEDDLLSLHQGKIYEARILTKGWFGIVDETNEEYAYPPELFEIIEF